MASIIGSDGFCVEYNVTDGEPREVFVNGDVIYRTAAEAERTLPPDNAPVETPDWRERLASEFVRHGLQKSSPRFGGHPAIAYWLEEQGLVKLEHSEQAQH